MGINLLTLDVGNPRNLGAIIRQAHVLGGERCKLYIFDPRNLLVGGESWVEATSIGLNGFANYETVGDLEKFLGNYGKRIIAADINPDAVPLHEFAFEDGDLIIFGNENTGLLDKELDRWEGLEHIDKYLVVPMLGDNYPKPETCRPVAPNHGLYPNLNVAATVGIVLYAALQQLGYFSEFSLEKIGS